MLAEHHTKTIIRGKAEERYLSSTVHARKGHRSGSILGRLFLRALPFLSSGAAKILGQFYECWLVWLMANRFRIQPIISQSSSGMRRKRRLQSSRKQSEKSKRIIEDIFAEHGIHAWPKLWMRHDRFGRFFSTTYSTNIEYSNYVEYHPLSSIADSRPIVFHVSSSEQIYLDFANTRPWLLVKAQITRGNGDESTDTDQVKGFNLFRQPIQASSHLAQ